MAAPHLAAEVSRRYELVNDSMAPPHLAVEFSRRYELVNVLAEGAFGTVWSGRDRDKVRRREQIVKVAVKVVVHGSEDFDLVQNEVEMHKKLFANGGSPLLVRLLDVVFEDTRTLLVLEHFDGDQLCARIDNAPCGRLHESAAAPILRELVSALSFMHANQVAHLDLKPENVLVQLRRSSPPRLKLLDYGSACASAPTRLQSRVACTAREPGSPVQCGARPLRSAGPTAVFASGPARCTRQRERPRARVRWH
jgi:serine/threonine protein kinase